MLNELIDASIRGTLLGISVFFWIFGIVAIWKWFFGVTKRFVLWLFHNWGKRKSESEE